MDNDALSVHILLLSVRLGDASDGVYALSDSTIFRYIVPFTDRWTFGSPYIVCSPLLLCVFVNILLPIDETVLLVL